MPMGGGCWNQWSDPDANGVVTVSCGKFETACPEGCEIWESVLTDSGFKWQRTGKDKVNTSKPGRFLCGCKNQG